MHFFIATNASLLDHLKFLRLLSGEVWRFSDAMASSNRDKGEGTLFRFHRISDLITVGNH